MNFFSVQQSSSISLFKSSIQQENSSYGYPDSRGLLIQDSSLTINLSQFKNIKTKGSGGVVNSLNSNLTISNSNFTDNSANIAGGFEVQCSVSFSCKTTLTNNSFSGNTAVLKGGVLDYNKNRPITINNFFDSTNYAPYGSQISGYPYDVKVLKYDNITLASGQNYLGTITVAIVDADYNIITDDNLSIIEVMPWSNNTRVLGQYQKQVTNGIVVFDDLQLSATPGSQNVSFLIQSSSIITAQLESNFQVNDTSINQDFVYFNFRLCELGEITSSDECVICSQGLYSLDPTSNSCDECLDDTQCPGGSQIDLDPGYWRSSFYSTNIMSCFNTNACVGGILSLDTSNQTYPYPLCSYGYGGKICDQCIKVDGIQFTKGSDHVCNVCPSKVKNIIAIMGTFIALVVGFFWLLWINLNSEKESQISIAIRILMNYFQILITAASYELNWPQYLEQFFQFYQSVGKLTEEYMSFDCFLDDTSLSQSGISVYYYKAIAITIIPIFILAVFSAAFGIGKQIFGYSRTKLIRQLTVTFMLTLFSLHPTITSIISGLYFCVQVDNGELWLQQDLDIRCWNSQHILWSLGIGLPSIIVWIIGVPLIGFIILYKNRENLEQREFFCKYKYIYQGLKEERYYWEFINICRKVVLISINVFLNLYPSIFKALLSLILLAVFQRVQKTVKPYRGPIFNVLEQREIFASISIFFGALFFLSSEIQPFIQVFVFIAILVFNFYFLVLCAYCVTSRMNWKIAILISRIIGKIALSDQLIYQDKVFNKNIDRKESRKSDQPNKKAKIAASISIENFDPQEQQIQQEKEKSIQKEDNKTNDGQKNKNRSQVHNPFDNSTAIKFENDDSVMKQATFIDNSIINNSKPSNRKMSQKQKDMLNQSKVTLGNLLQKQKIKNDSNYSKIDTSFQGNRLEFKSKAINQQNLKENELDIFDGTLKNNTNKKTRNYKLSQQQKQFGSTHSIEQTTKFKSQFQSIRKQIIKKQMEELKEDELEKN